MFFSSSVVAAFKFESNSRTMSYVDNSDGFTRLCWSFDTKDIENVQLYTGQKKGIGIIGFSSTQLIILPWSEYDVLKDTRNIAHATFNLPKDRGVEPFVDQLVEGYHLGYIYDPLHKSLVCVFSSELLTSASSGMDFAKIIREMPLPKLMPIPRFNINADVRYQENEKTDTQHCVIFDPELASQIELGVNDDGEQSKLTFQFEWEQRNELDELIYGDIPLEFEVHAYLTHNSSVRHIFDSTNLPRSSNGHRRNYTTTVIQPAQELIVSIKDDRSFIDPDGPVKIEACIGNQD